MTTPGIVEGNADSDQGVAVGRHQPALRRSTALAHAAILSLLITGHVGAQVPEPSSLRPANGMLGEGFTDLRWVRELADGQLILADPKEARLVVADLRAGAVRDIARRGQGPGEFHLITGLFALGPDSTLVEDRTARRWILFDGSRAVATVSSIPNAGGPAAALAGADRGGRVLDIQAFAFRKSPGVPYTPFRANAESLLVLVRHRVATDRSTAGRLTGRVDTIARIRGVGRGQTLVWRDNPPPASHWLLENPLAAEEQALLFPDGWIALAYAEPYRVEWISPDGGRIRGPALPRAPVAVDDRVKRAIIAWRWPKVTPPFTSGELPAWPSELPPFLNDALLAANDGRLAIRRAQNPLEPHTLYDVVDRQGKLTGQLALKANERLVGFGARSVYVVVRDEDDVEWLRRHPWP